MNDILPQDSATWRYLESVVREVVQSYGYKEIRLPLLEYTELFQRSIGDETDIVAKEMYTFLDRNEESLTLRPEATASMVRAGITNGLLHNQRQKLWTAGPMFRYEKPQKGRYRQFHQFDVEAMGYPGPDVDAELIIMCARMWQKLGLSRLTLEINSLGTPDSRVTYREALLNYFSTVKSGLDEVDPGTDIYDVEEHFMVHMQLSGNLRYYWERGAHANMEIPNETRIYGTRGGIKLGYCSWDDPVVIFYDLDENGRAREQKIELDYRDCDDGFALSEHLVRVLDGVEKPVISLEKARKHMDIIFKCYEKADNSL